MENKSHLTIEGINQIINIKAAMNLGLSELLKYEFKDFILSPSCLSGLSCLSCLSCLCKATSKGCKATSFYSYKNQNKGCQARARGLGGRPIIQTEIIPDPY
jgi:hypothetical protein